MNDPCKKISVNSRTSLKTLQECGENDDISVTTGGSEKCAVSPSTKFPPSTSAKQTMQSASGSDAADSDVGMNRRSFHAQLSRSFFQSRSSSSSSVDGGPSSPSKSRLGTVPVEDPITHENVVNSKVLLLYTGGALGWKLDPNLEGKYSKVRNIITYDVTDCLQGL